MMIHDSFGTTPGEMDTLDIVREQFINLYTNYDPFAVLRVTWVNDGVDERVPSLDRDGCPACCVTVKSPSAALIPCLCRTKATSTSSNGFICHGEGHKVMTSQPRRGVFCLALCDE